MKKNRQAIIAKLIEENVISTQEDLLARLLELVGKFADGSCLSDTVHTHNHNHIRFSGSGRHIESLTIL